jgi:hypothetical protein
MLAVSVVLVGWGPTALGAHIPDTGPLPDNCVEFQANNLGTKSPPDYPDVDITLDDWGDLHEITFIISGLDDDEDVDISVKSGTTVQEAGPYGNGTHTFDNSLQQEISHIRICVFEEETTTTTEATTTTSEATTTTTEETTTTTEGTTTTTEGTTTTTTIGTTTSTVDDEVLGTVVTTTTVAGEVDETVVSTLPFTGAQADGLGQLALALTALGCLLLVLFRGGVRDEPS